MYDFCYFVIIGTDITFNHTNSAIHSSGHSRSLLTPASDNTSVRWRLVLHILFSTCQQVLGYPCHTWYSLGPKPLTHNHSTRAGPAKIRCGMTGVFDRKWEGCTSVPKQWGCFKWTLKIFANFDPWLNRVICWCVISLRRCRMMTVHKWWTFRLKRQNLLSPTADACCPLLALRSSQLMTGEPRPQYSALQLLGVSGACGWSIACRCCSKYIFILDLIPAWLQWLCRGNCKTKRETLKWCDLVRLILAVWRYTI